MQCAHPWPVLLSLIMTRRIGKFVVFAACNTPLMLLVHWLGMVSVVLTRGRTAAEAPIADSAIAAIRLLIIDFILTSLSS